MCEPTQPRPAPYPSTRWGPGRGENQSGSQAAVGTTAGAGDGGAATARSSLPSLSAHTGEGGGWVFDAARNISNSNLGLNRSSSLASSAFPGWEHFLLSDAVFPLGDPHRM